MSQSLDGQTGPHLSEEFREVGANSFSLVLSVFAKRYVCIRKPSPKKIRALSHGLKIVFLSLN